jgi:DNA-directed RNA polymerase specialized sigma subunit
LEKVTEEQRRMRQRENEEKKEYLQSYKKFKQKAKRLEEQLAELRLGEMMPSLVTSDMPSAHNQRDLSDYMVKYDKLYSQIIKARKDTIERFTEVQQQIELLLDENEKTVLTLRYLRSYGWERICVEMNYSWRQVHYIHSRALEHFEMIA